MPNEAPLSAETIRNFLYASTATVSMQMLKRGFRKPMDISEHDAPRVKVLLGAKKK